MGAAVGNNLGVSGTPDTGSRYKVTPESIRRGQLLAAWMQEHGYSRADLARETGISKMTIGTYLNGKLDIANMHQTTVERLLTAMHVSDTWAQDYFEIPVAQRLAWRTFRDLPMGSGERAPQQVITLVLDGPLSGEGYAAPAGTVATYEPGTTTDGLLLTRLQGRYVVALIDALPSQGDLLGRFLGVSPAQPATRR